MDDDVLLAGVVDAYLDSSKKPSQSMLAAQTTGGFGGSRNRRQALPPPALDAVKDSKQTTSLFAATTNFGARYIDPRMEGEFLVYFYTHRGVPILFTAIALCITVIGGIAVSLLTSALSPLGLGFFVSAWIVWAATGVVMFVKQKERTRWVDRQRRELDDDSGTRHHQTPAAGDDNPTRWEASKTKDVAQDDYMNLLSDSSSRVALRKNARDHELLLLSTNIASGVFIFGVYLARLECAGGLAAEDYYDFCLNAMVLDSIILIFFSVSFVITPMRLRMFTAATLLTAVGNFAFRFLPGAQPIVFRYFFSNAVLVGAEACGCVAAVSYRERSARQQFELYVVRNLRALEVQKVRRQVAKMMSAQVPLAAVRKGALDDEDGMCNFQARGAVCVLRIEGFALWCSVRAPCDAVELLQRVHDSFDKVRESSPGWMRIGKYHAMGDMVLLTSHAANDSSDVATTSPAVLSASCLLLVALRCVGEGHSLIGPAEQSWGSENALLTQYTDETKQQSAAPLTIQCSLAVGTMCDALMRVSKNITLLGGAVDRAVAAMQRDRHGRLLLGTECFSSVLVSEEILAAVLDHSSWSASAVSHLQGRFQSDTVGVAVPVMCGVPFPEDASSVIVADAVLNCFLLHNSGPLLALDSNKFLRVALFGSTMVTDLQRHADNPSWAAAAFPSTPSDTPVLSESVLTGELALNSKSSRRSGKHLDAKSSSSTASDSKRKQSDSFSPILVGVSTGGPLVLDNGEAIVSSPLEDPRGSSRNPLTAELPAVARRESQRPTSLIIGTSTRYKLTTTAIPLVYRFEDPLVEHSYEEHCREAGDDDYVNVKLCAAFCLLQSVCLVVICAINGLWDFSINGTTLWVTVTLGFGLCLAVASRIDSLRDQRMLFVSLFVAYVAFFITSVFVAQRGTVFGNGHIAWLYVLFGLSVKRPRWTPLAAMSLLEFAIGIAFLIITCLHPSHPSPAIFGMEVYIDVITPCGFLLIRLQWEQQRREEFAVQQEAMMLEEMLDEDYRRLQESLVLLGPQGVAHELIVKARKDVTKQLDQLHPDHSTNFTTVGGDVPLLLVEFAPCQGDNNLRNNHLVSSTAKVDALRFATVKPMKNALTLASAILVKYNRLEIIKATGHLLMVASPRPSEEHEDDADQTDEHRSEQLFHFAIQFVRALRGEDACGIVTGSCRSRMLITYGPMMGAVIGRGSVSFEYYGAPAAEAMECLVGLPWGSFFVLNRFARLIAVQSMAHVTSYEVEDSFTLTDVMATVGRAERHQYRGLQPMFLRTVHLYS